MNASGKRLVPVRIQGREYRIRAEGEGDSLLRAAELVDQTIDRVRSRAGTVDSMDVAVLAALNLANSVVSRRTASIEHLADRVTALIGRLETALGDEDAGA